MRKIMGEKGITASYIANKIGISVAAVSKWVNGKGFPEVNHLFYSPGSSVSQLMRL